MLKHLARYTAHHLGAIDALQRLNENRVRILMYHRFPRPLLKNFDAQCAFLAANYKVVSLDEAAQRLVSHQPVKSMAVITIDDGYADSYDVALPVLRKYRLPATLFVTTGFIDRTCWMPGDHVRYHFANCPDDTVKITDGAGSSRVFRAKESGADGMRALLKRVPQSTKERMLSELAAKVPLPDAASAPQGYRPCTWDQLRELADNEISIGAHTVTHPILSRLESAVEVRREIVDSKLEIEARLGRPVTSFAYPNGLPEDIDQGSIDCVRANFGAAVTAVDGLNASGMDPHQLLRRPCDPGTSIPQFAQLLAGPLSARRALPSSVLSRS